MKILAFDIAYQTGWAATEGPGVVLVYGSFGVECDGENGLGRCLYNFRRELYRLIDKRKPDVLAWELPLPATLHGARYDDFVRGAVGILRVAAFELDLIALACDQKQVRKHFIGDGRPSPEAKRQVWFRCKALGYHCANDDESDAIAVWDYATGLMKVREYEQKDRARLRREAGR
jgi:Holliday junction resolvasome RuvABC endonuclease subunit